MLFQCFSDDIEELPEVLAEKVPLIPELLVSARADSTTISYMNSFQMIEVLGVCNSVGEEDIFPAKPFIFALYLCSLVQSTSTPSPMIKAFYSVKYVYDLYGLKSPTESTYVKNLLEAAKRRLSHLVVRKEPITSKIFGGATSAANNGIKDRLSKRHGRWKSDKAKDGYIKDSLKRDF
ncbi:uncharacterized protein [Palaemon carinicauda]|uniref:uncharacterized protein n=1 Tax=Palaemon carinicauda TaxID=392227 RepID=UPI0035B57241